MSDSMNALTEFIYATCSSRIRKKMSTPPIYQHEVYASNRSIISAIINNCRGQKNPYLVTKSALLSNDGDGIVPMCKFKNVHEALWGDDTEINKNLFFYFISFISIITDKPKKYRAIQLEYILQDYVPYSFNLTYAEILRDESEESSRALYLISKNKVLKDLPLSREDAIDYLYFRCAEDFKQCFVNFTAQMEDFKKLETKLINFIENDFASMLKKYYPNTGSLGIRTKYIIENDLSTSKNIIQHNFEVLSLPLRSQLKLNHASSNYILELETIQHDLASHIERKCLLSEIFDCFDV